MKPNDDPNVLGRMQIRWMRNATQGTELQAVADGRAMADPLWAVAELRKLASIIEARGGFDFMADLDAHGRPMGQIPRRPAVAAVRQGVRSPEAPVLRPRGSE